MEKAEKLCAYIADTIDGGSECKILTTEGCDGKDISCSFYKTVVQAKLDSDRAIEACRRRGLCEKCAYREISCRKSTER